MYFRNKTNGEVIQAEESSIALFRSQPHLIELDGYVATQDDSNASDDEPKEPQNEPKEEDENEEIPDSPAATSTGGKRKRAA